jgi:hypothetical protein
VPLSEQQVSDRAYEDGISEAERYVREVRDEQRDDQLRSVRAGSAAGDRAFRLRLIDSVPRLALPGEEGFLEAATADTYLAAEEETLGLNAEAR